MSEGKEKSIVSEIVKIVLGSVIIAILYGIVHDMVTAHTEISYFTLFHVKVVESQSPVILALVWGVIATWWVGGIAGLLVAASAQMGSKPKFSARRALGYVVRGAIFTLVVAMGSLAYFLGSSEGRVLEFQPDPSDLSGRFYAVFMTHNISYWLSAIVTIVVCVVITLKRSKEAI